MSDYLSLVTDFIMETSLSGGSPPDNVATATGDQRKACYWIQQADLQIQREWINWDFMWGRATVSLSANSSIIPTVTESQNGSDVGIVNMVKRKSLAVMQADGSPHFPAWNDWNNSEFSRLYTYQLQPDSDTASAWSMRPDRVILLSSPIESAATAIYDYYRKSRRMFQNSDISLVPDDFTRLIVVLGKIMYAEHEDAPEVSAGAHEEYDTLISMMESVHLPDQGFNRESHSDDDLVVVSE